MREAAAKPRPEPEAGDLMRQAIAALGRTEAAFRRLADGDREAASSAAYLAAAIQALGADMRGLACAITIGERLGTVPQPAPSRPRRVPPQHRSQPPLMRVV
jgi:hypothetical protein